MGFRNLNVLKTDNPNVIVVESTTRGARTNDSVVTDASFIGVITVCDGLARSKRASAAINMAGAEAHTGSLEDLESMRTAVKRVDAAIHTAFNHSSALRFPRNAKIERKALHGIAEILAGTGRPLVAAAGFTPAVATGPVFTELDSSSPAVGPAGRNVKRTIMRLADGGVNPSVVRLPCMHGENDHFTIPRFIEIARKKRKSGFVDDGCNRLPAVHNIDAARVFRPAMERGVPDSRYHAVAEEGVPFRRITEVIGQRLDVPVVSVPRRAARRHFGSYASYAQNDGPASSTPTRKQLSWTPEGPSLLADIDRPEYVAG